MAKRSYFLAKRILFGKRILYWRKEKMQMAYKEYREMKVYEQSGYQYKPTPTIVLKGKWLEELGFVSGTPVVVKCQDGQLTITLMDEVTIME